MVVGAVILKAGIFLVTQGVFSAVIYALQVQHHMGLLETNETKNTKGSFKANVYYFESQDNLMSTSLSNIYVQLW